jgi:hypothetical protein
MLWLFFACSGSQKESSLELSEAASMVYGYSHEDRLMVVISDLPSLCAELQSGEPPQGDWWTLSLWTQNRAVEEGLYPAFGHLNISESRSFSADTALDYWRTAEPVDASLDIKNVSENAIRGEYYASFEGDISTVLTSSLEATPCEGIYLFAGLEE